MRNLTIMVANAAAVMMANVGLELWVRRVHWPSRSVPMGAGMAYFAVLMLVSALTTYWLTGPPQLAPRHRVMLAAVNLILASAVLYVFVAWKDDHGEAPGLAITYAVLLAIGAGFGLMAGARSHR